MIQSLSIRNYALIDQLHVDMHPGMTAITGETGSGKSILLGALGLALGQRADLKALHHHESKCVVELLVRMGPEHRTFFDAYDLDYWEECIVRREITPSGKSRSFINDTPVALNVTRELAARVVDIHSQHANSILADATFQLGVLDAVAGNTEQKAAYASAFDTWQTARDAHLALREQMEQWKRDADYMAFQLRELEALPLDDLDLDALETDVARMERADEIRHALSAVCGHLQGGDSAAEAQLAGAQQAADRIADVSPELSELADRLKSVVIEVNDLAATAEGLAQHTDSDPESLLTAREHLNALITLQQKHLADSVQALVDKRDELRNALGQTAQSDSQLEALAAAESDALESLLSRAEALSTSRTGAVPTVVADLRSMLDALGLERAVLDVDLQRMDDCGPSGRDRATFTFTANPGSPALPLTKVASGGEMSRVMLALKAALAKRRNLPCLIFDEIDTGISGEMARKMGLVLRALSTHSQLVVITHQPSIAGLAASQYKVFKTTDGQSTRTGLQVLDAESRVQEIAEMIAGSNVTEAARASARELLES